MAEDVKYEMTLNDLVSAKLQQAESHARHFEGSIGSLQHGLHTLGERAIRVGETLGISFAFYNFEQFFTKSTEAVHELDVSEGQLENTLRNVGDRAGLTADQLIEMAQKTQHEIPFTTDKIVDMETAISRFGNESPKLFQKVLAASADMAIALKRDGTETAMMLGRIMEKPAENARLLRQFNITLTAEQRKYLLMLERTGQTAKEQTFIFQELAEKGYGGAARAAANSDPIFRYNKAIYELEMQIGKVGIALEEIFAPGLEFVSHTITMGVHYAQTFFGYLKDNAGPILKEIKGDAIALGIGIGVAGAAFLIAHPSVIAYGFSLAADAVISGALAVVTGVLTAAQWALNVAMSANPLAIVALVAGFILAYKHSEKFRGILAGLGEIAKDIGGIFKGLGEMIWGALTFDPSKIKAGFETMAASFRDVGSAFHRGYEQSIAESHREDEREKHESTIAKQQKKTSQVKPPVAGPTIPKGSTSKVTGSKVINIHLAIQQLGCGLIIKTTNIHESAQKIHDHIVNALTGAVNDSQQLAGE